MDLRNTKIDLRRPDGSIDKEKSAAFLQLATGGDVRKFQRQDWKTFEEMKSVYSVQADFVVVNSAGQVSSMSSIHEDFFKNLEGYREIVCEPEYFVAYKRSDEELARESKIAELSAQLKQIQSELAELKAGAK